MKYNVMFSIDASVSIEVDADSEKEAEDIAWANIDNPRICHCCSKAIDIGDIQKVLEVSEA